MISHNPNNKDCIQDLFAGPCTCAAYNAGISDERHRIGNVLTVIALKYEKEVLELQKMLREALVPPREEVLQDLEGNTPWS